MGVPPLGYDAGAFLHDHSRCLALVQSGGLAEQEFLRGVAVFRLSG
jgi:hypothetical protein